MLISNEWLRTLKVGDEVVYGHSILKVTRLTSTQILVFVNPHYEARFRKTDGGQVGYGTHTYRIREATPELREKLTQAALKQWARDDCAREIFRLTHDQIAQVKALVKGFCNAG